MSDYPRRSFLLASVGVLSSLAGCSSALINSEGVVLSELELENIQNETREFNVRIEYNNEVVHRSSHEVKPASTTNERVIVEFDIPDEPGDITLHAKVDDQQESANFLEWGDDGYCLRALVRLDSEDLGGAVGIFRHVYDCDLY